MENDTGHEAAQENARKAHQQEVTPSGTHLALAQSLKAAGEAQQDGHAGWSVISGRAELFVRAVGIGVTRLLFQPDLRLRDPAVDEDLQVLACAISDDFTVKVTTMGRESHKVRTHELAEMHVAGPVNDAVRATVAAMMQTLVEDSIGNAVASGQLPGLASFDKLHQLSTVVAMTPEALVDKHWDQLEASPTEDRAFISRAELADAMLAATLAALGSTGELATGGDVSLDPSYPGQEPLEELVAPPSSETVHHLQTHAGYVMDRDGSCKPEGEQ